jgi:hypothetical protein
MPTTNAEHEGSEGEDRQSFTTDRRLHAPYTKEKKRKE